MGGLRGFGVTASLSAQALAEPAREAEQLGYSSFWVNDVPHADGLARCRRRPARRPASQLGVGVVPLDQRPPDTIAATIEASGLPRHRLVLGVGSGGSSGALARVRAGVEALRGAAAKVVVGALGPRMAALAGEVADGVLLNWVTAEHAGRSARWVVERRPPRTGRGRPCSGTCDAGCCRERRGGCREEVARYAGCRSSTTTSSAWERPRPTRRPAGRRRALQARIAPYEAVLDETIVRAITPDDSVASLCALLRACAP